MVRVTQEGMVQNALLRVHERISKLDASGRRLSSGKVVQVASDDVSGMNRILGLRARIRAREQEARSAADGQTWLNIADSKLQTLNSRLLRVRELAVRGATSLDAAGREALAREIETIRDDMAAIANSSINGRQLFAGTANVAETVTVPGFAYGGDGNAVMRRIGEGEMVAVNVSAGQVFGFDDGQDIFTELNNLATDLRAGNLTAVSGRLANLDTAMERVNTGLAAVGAATNRIDAAMVRNSDEQLALKGELAKVEDVDLAEAIMDLQTQEVAYQATLAALSRVLQPSLIDFIR